MKKISNRKRSFMTRIGQLKALNKQHYVVLRPAGRVGIVWETIRNRLRKKFQDMAITDPNAGHMMLRGFPEARTVRLRKSISEWAKNSEPLKLEMNKVTSFPEPSKVVIFEIKKTTQLIRAYMSLAKATARFPRFPDDRTVDEWIFHMSIIYCGDTTAQEWEEVLKFIKTIKAGKASCRVNEIELVSYHDLVETIETFKLGK